jgi:hypothetical protein
VRSYRTFSPLLAGYPASGIFSVALSVACAFSAHPRPLAGMLPYEDRTFLSTHSRTSASSSCPTAQADSSIEPHINANGNQRAGLLLQNRHVVIALGFVLRPFSVSRLGDVLQCCDASAGGCTYHNF